MPMGYWKEGLSVCLLCLVSQTVGAVETVPSGYQVVAAERAIPEAIFYAVALTESGRDVEAQGIRRPWPWTLNVAGQGYYFETQVIASVLSVDHSLSSDIVAMTASSAA